MTDILHSHTQNIIETEIQNSVFTASQSNNIISISTSTRSTSRNKINSIWVIIGVVIFIAIVILVSVTSLIHFINFFIDKRSTKSEKK